MLRANSVCNTPQAGIGATTLPNYDPSCITLPNVEVVILNQGEDTTFEEDFAKAVLEISTQKQKLMDDVKKAVAESAKS